MVDLIDFEKKVKRIYELRKNVAIQQNKINQLVKEVKDHMNKEKITRKSFAKYGCEVLTRRDRRFDKKVVLRWMDEKRVPDISFEKTSYVLMVSSTDDIRLEGNKFVKS